MQVLKGLKFQLKNTADTLNTNAKGFSTSDLYGKLLLSMLSSFMWVYIGPGITGIQKDTKHPQTNIRTPSLENVKK